MIESAVIAGLAAVGVDVVDLGVVTTPGVGVMVRHLAAAGGVVITASHNPPQYNGIKLLLSSGMAPHVAAAEQIRAIFLARRFCFADSLRCGTVVPNAHTDALHIAKLLPIVEREIIAGRFKVVLDSVNGAGGRVGAKLLNGLGCKVVPLNDAPTGIFARNAEPIAENLAGLCELVKTEKANIGFALDPDGDRLAIVDETGACLGEEYTLALAAKYILGKKPGLAAANLSTSRMIDDVAQATGSTVIRTAVGEANVASVMVEKNCVIGGEGNGGVIDLRVGPVRDSLVGMALVLQLMAETGKPVSELAREIGSYHMIKDKFALPAAVVPKVLEAARKLFSDAAVNTVDGCRFDFADGWLHVRPSNTEPIIRVIAEARDEKATRKYIDAVVGLLGTNAR
jgi:phosphomannomutase